MYKGIADYLESDINCAKEYLHAALKGQTKNQELEHILYDAVNNPGKMIRPLILFLTAGDYEEGLKDELMTTAAAVELLHISTLILDDMIDGSPLRRGEMTIQAEYGSDVALYAGDYLLVRAYSYLLEKGYTDQAGTLMKVGQTACDGEMCQHDNLNNLSVKMDDYLRAINGKTAFFFREICSMACRITKMDEKTSKLYEGIGETIGMMFQIRDDLLDWTGESRIIGKPANEDFLEGIYTMPAIYTFSREWYGDRLREIAKKDNLSPKDMIKAVRLVEDSGGIAYTKEYLINESKKALDMLSVLDHSRYTESLGMIIDYCTKQDWVR